MPVVCPGARQDRGASPKHWQRTPRRVDPFIHHPELRDMIADPLTSFFRSFSVDRIVAENPELEDFRLWVHTDETREAIRAEALAGHSGDLWVFAYGSLMWDPALRFAEVRRAHAPDHERRFILREDKGGRGTAEAPGLMAALDEGAGCDGLVFRIEAGDVETETEILFRREMLAPGYLAVFVPVQIGEEAVRALAFLADHGAPEICGDISWQDQVRMIATGAGMLGTSRDYLANIVRHFDHLGIEDAECTALLREADAWIAAHPGDDPDSSRAGA